MQGGRQVAHWSAEMLGRAAAGLTRLAGTFLAILFAPGSHLPEAASGSAWPFSLSLILSYSILAPVALRLSWPAVSQTVGLRGVLDSSGMLVLFGSLLVFFLALILAAVLCVRLFAGQRADLLTAANCVAVAVVPLFALTVCAWVVLYLNAGLSLLVLLFGLLVALCFLAEALRSQYDMTTGCSLYAIPLMVVLALLATGLLLFALSARQIAV